MARYVPAPVNGDLTEYLQNELAKVAQAMETANQVLNLDMQYAAPKKYRDGTIVLADGVSFNPGSGAGFYGYRAGAWRFLG
jgi:hypothetical protein